MKDSIRKSAIIIAGVLIIPFFIYGSIGLDWFPNYLGLSYSGYSPNDPIRDITFSYIPNDNVSTSYIIIALLLFGFILYHLGYLLGSRSKVLEFEQA